MNGSLPSDPMKAVACFMTVTAATRVARGDAGEGREKGRGGEGRGGEGRRGQVGRGDGGREERRREERRGEERR